MLVEHSFVTTLPAPQVMAATSEMLGHHGFVSEQAAAFQLDEPQWTRLQMKRGKASARRAANITQFPQRIIMEWDRGRVTVAAALEARVVRRSFTISASSALSRVGKKQSKQYAALMTAIVESIESLLVDRVSEDHATQHWMEVEGALIAAARRARRRSIIFLLIFIAFIAAIITTAVISAHH